MDVAALIAPCVLVSFLSIKPCKQVHPKLSVNNNIVRINNFLTGGHETPRKRSRMEDAMLIRVGGAQFSVDSNTIQAMDSDFLTKLTAEDSPFAKLDNGVYDVTEADPNASWRY
jgi:hypothetical protein